MSGAGVGVGMLRGAGDSLTWKQKVSWFLGFLLVCFLVSKFAGFLVQKFKDSMIPCCEISISCSRAHIRDLQRIIRRIFTIVRCLSFPTLSKSVFVVEICEILFFKNDLVFFLNYWRALVSPKIKMVCGAQGHVRKSRNYEIDGGWVFSNNESEKS